MPRIMKHSLDFLLIIIAIVSFAGIFLAHEDPFARDAFCAKSAWCPQVANAKGWGKIAYDLSIGALTSLIFYILIVRIPDFQKRSRYKRSLARQYKFFREDIIALIVGAADGQYEAGMPEKLLDQKEFKTYFKMKVGQGQDRWDRFCNNLDPYHLKEIVKRMEIFRDEISFILNNADIPSDEPFEFLKRLSAAIYLARDTTLEYDDVKSFARFLWEIFAGFNFVTGYRERDIIQEMIDAI